MYYQQDYSHPSLGTGFGPGFKVIGGYDLVGNEYVPGEWMIVSAENRVSQFGYMQDIPTPFPTRYVASFYRDYC